MKRDRTALALEMLGSIAAALAFGWILLAILFGWP